MTDAVRLAVEKIPHPDVAALDLGEDATFLMALAVLFAVLGVAIIALRNSGYGRRLTAMKDSPAAAAMLGQSLVRLKLGVFMLSAAIAGLGSILMTTAVGSVAPDNFLITASLALRPSPFRDLLLDVLEHLFRRESHSVFARVEHVRIGKHAHQFLLELRAIHNGFGRYQIGSAFQLDGR